MLRLPVLLATTVALLATFELPAQGRGRRGQRPGGEAPPTAPTPEAIDAAILADKLADGYNQRNIERAIKLEQQNPKD